MSKRGGQDIKCILLSSNNKAVKKPWVEASELVDAGKARFISQTEFKARVAGVKIPPDVKKQGDRAIKDYIKSRAAPSKPPSKPEVDEMGEKPEMSEKGGRKARKKKD